MYRKWKIQTEAIGTPRVRKKNDNILSSVQFLCSFFKRNSQLSLYQRKVHGVQDLQL